MNSKENSLIEQLLNTDEGFLNQFGLSEFLKANFLDFGYLIYRKEDSLHFDVLITNKHKTPVANLLLREIPIPWHQHQTHKFLHVLMRNYQKEEDLALFSRSPIWKGFIILADPQELTAFFSIRLRA